MGYANTLGDYRNTKTGQVISDALYNTFRTRVPGFRASDYVKVVVAVPAPAPAPSPVFPLLKPFVPVLPVPVVRVTPVAPTAPPTTTPTSVVETINKVAPIVGTALGPVIGPISSTIPMVTDAATQTPPGRIRFTPDVVTSPVPSAAATSAGGGASSPSAELYNADGSPINQAAVTASTANVLAKITSLPPLVLAAIAGGLLLVFSQRRR